MQKIVVIFKDAPVQRIFDRDHRMLDSPFSKRFGPATIGSAGTQIALFADTIIASFLAAGLVLAR